ncbi:MAG: SAM-dependent methyltransferase [Acidobacteria bacterium]|nr:MAG: SAM-dependent methyltransferase [Acidobacteriota bacterium]
MFFTRTQLTPEITGDIAVGPKIKENYDSYYDGESSWRALGAISKAQNIVDLCSSIPHQRILDIGSGEGSVVRRLSDLGFGEEVHSVEISQSAVETILRRGIARLQECRLFDGYNLPYESGRFDLAILSHVLEHVEYPRKLLYEAGRIANYVFVEVPLEDNIGMKPDYRFDSVGHINFYTWKTIRRLVQTCGFQVLSQVTTNPSRETYEYQYGRKGILKYFIKEYLLSAAPGLACVLFTYHAALLCTASAE